MQQSCTRTVSSEMRNMFFKLHVVLQELDRMPIPSITMIVDASPKAKMDVSCLRTIH